MTTTIPVECRVKILGDRNYTGSINIAGNLYNFSLQYTNSLMDVQEGRVTINDFCNRTNLTLNKSPDIPEIRELIEHLTSTATSYFFYQRFTSKSQKVKDWLYNITHPKESRKRMKFRIKDDEGSTYFSVRINSKKGIEFLV